MKRALLTSLILAVFGLSALRSALVLPASAQGGAGELSVNVNNGAGALTPGTDTQYAIVVSNAGTDPAAGVALDLNVDAALQNEATSCTTSAGADCGSGHGYSLTLGPGESATVTLSAHLDPAARGSVTVSAQISAPAGFTDPDPANNSASDSDPLDPLADLYGQLNLSAASAQRGQALTLTLVVGNDGPSTATGTAAVAIPAEWDGAACDAPCSIAGGQWQFAFALGPKETMSVGLSANVRADAPAGRVSLRADAVAGEADPNTANNTHWQYMDVVVPARLGLTMTDSGGPVHAGAAVAYQVNLTNQGEADTPILLTVSAPPTLINVAWRCVSGCAGSGTGTPTLNVTLPPGGTAQVEVTGQIAADASGSVTLTADAQPQVPGAGANASDTIPVAPTATPTAVPTTAPVEPTSAPAPAVEQPTQIPAAAPADTDTPTAAATRQPGPTWTASATPTMTATPLSGAQAAPTATATASASATATATASPSPAPTVTSTATPTSTASPTPIPVMALTARPLDSGRSRWGGLLAFAGLLALAVSPLPTLAAVHDARPKVLRETSAFARAALARQTGRRTAPPQPRAPLAPSRRVTTARKQRYTKGNS